MLFRAIIDHYEFLDRAHSMTASELLNYIRSLDAFKASGNAAQYQCMLEAVAEHATQFDTELIDELCEAGVEAIFLCNPHISPALGEYALRRYAQQGFFEIVMNGLWILVRRDALSITPDTLNLIDECMKRHSEWRDPLGRPWLDYTELLPLIREGLARGNQQAEIRSDVLETVKKRIKASPYFNDWTGITCAQHKHTSASNILDLYHDFPTAELVQGIAIAASQRPQLLLNAEIRELLWRQSKDLETALLLLNTPSTQDVAEVFDMVIGTYPSELEILFESPDMLPEILSTLGEKRLQRLLTHSNRTLRIKAIAALAHLPSQVEKDAEGPHAHSRP